MNKGSDPQECFAFVLESQTQSGTVVFLYPQVLHPQLRIKNSLKENCIFTEHVGVFSCHDYLNTVVQQLFIWQLQCLI